MLVTSGSSTTGSSGLISIKTANSGADGGTAGTTGGVSGAITLSTGAATTGNSGAFVVGTGNSVDGVGGGIAMTVGSGTTGTGGPTLVSNLLIQRPESVECWSNSILKFVSHAYCLQS